MKYAEYNGREDQDPWSIRQSAVYQQYNSLTGSSVYILLSPYPRSVVEEQYIMAVAAAQQGTAFEASRLRFGSVLMDAYLHNWREYLSFYEQRIDALVSRFELAAGKSSFLGYN